MIFLEVVLLEDEQKFYFNKDAMRLLQQSCFLEPPYFMCFGKYYPYLKKFNLIDNEYNPTYDGRRMVHYCLAHGYLDDPSKNH